MAQHPDIADLTLTSVLAALADPIRMGLVQTLADGEERAWSELTAPVAKSTLSHHLKVLRSAGVTRTRQEGTRCYVRLRCDDLDERFPGVLRSILTATEHIPSPHVATEGG
jgi:DNA-binding transcriptional ArsR family regulator